MSYDIIAIPAFNDNYIWMIVHHEKKLAVVVDPGEAQPVLDTLAQQKLKLIAILITHHHWDHTGGIDALYQKYSIPVYGPKHENIPYCHYPLSDGDEVKIDAISLKFKVLEVPGHTQGHIAYVGHDWLFCGDTLFSAGCGRLFEGTPEQLYHSLQTLAALKPTTQVYCAHEYTLNNLKFAETVEPNNQHIQQYKQQVESQMCQKIPSLPSSISLERQVNPFLRCHSTEIQQTAEQYAGHPLSNLVAVFTALRLYKDNF